MSQGGEPSPAMRREPSGLSNRLPRLLRSPGALFGVPVVLLVVTAALFAQYVSPHDPFQQDLNLRLQPPFWEEGGELSRPLGTDQFGRCLFSRIILGGRASIIVGVSAVLLSALIGIPVGLIAGYSRGRVDEVIMAIADVQYSFPFLFLALVLSYLLGPSLHNTVLALGFAGWVTYARVTRGEVLSIRERDYILAARAIGCSATRTVVRHVLPQVVTPLIVVGTLQTAWMIVVEASLSYLGMGVQPPTPSWGNILAEGRLHMLNSWWYATFPGIAITITVLGLNMMGDWLRDVLDPRSRLRSQ
ncbi:MAG: ABC transporter permease [Bryobacterales bacterium]|nr:ABC transporter permease [Bryobacterales bacterium]